MAIEAEVPLLFSGIFALNNSFSKNPSLIQHFNNLFIYAAVTSLNNCIQPFYFNSGIGLQELNTCCGICEILLVAREWHWYFPKATLEIHVIYTASLHVYLLRVATIYTALIIF